MEVEGNYHNSSYASFEEPTETNMNNLEQTYTDVQENTEQIILDQSEESLEPIAAPVEQTVTFVNTVQDKENNSCITKLENKLGKDWLLICIFVIIKFILIAILFYNLYMKFFKEPVFDDVVIPTNPTKLEMADFVSNYVH